MDNLYQMLKEDFNYGVNSLLRRSYVSPHNITVEIEVGLFYKSPDFVTPLNVSMKIHNRTF
jgi:hypothetical protein